MMNYIVSFIIIFFVAMPLIFMLDDFLTEKLDKYIEDKKSQKVSGFNENKRS